MARVEEYSSHIKKLLSKYAKTIPSDTKTMQEYEMQIIADEKHNHYQLLDVGWDGYQRIFNTMLHLDIKDGKIWVQQDNTEIGIANELVEIGVPKEDIVLAFYAPYRRQDTEFAVG